MHSYFIPVSIYIHNSVFQHVSDLLLTPSLMKYSPHVCKLRDIPIRSLATNYVFLRSSAMKKRVNII